MVYQWLLLDSTAVSIFVVIVVELTNTVFINSTNITTNIETAELSIHRGQKLCVSLDISYSGRFELPVI